VAWSSSRPRASAGPLPEPSLYLFDGYNLLHAGAIDSRDELVDRLAGFVAVRGARGVVVFDGVGVSRSLGPLEVRFADHADEVIERLAAETRTRERVAVVSSDSAIRETAGPTVQRLSSRTFSRELERETPDRWRGGPDWSRIEDVLDPDVRARLEAWRRGTR
jgi:predicted RNA-binding protein with PIN domain